jgi:hypothetical protein
MMRSVLSILVLLALAPHSAAEEPASFELQWNGSGDASIKIDPQQNGEIVVSSSLPMEDASVPWTDIFCIQDNDQSRERCRSQDPTEFMRVMSMKWIDVGGDRYLLVAWTVYHTCTADEPTHYFKVVDGRDFSRNVGFAARVWRQSNNALKLTVRPVMVRACARPAPGRPAA